MADKNEKYLAPIREICKKIKENDSISSYISELNKKALEQQFYGYNVFDIVLKFLRENPKLEEFKIIEIFKLLNKIFEKYTDLSKILLSFLYNFLIKAINETNSKVLIINEALKLSALKAVPNAETIRTYLYLTDFFMKQDFMTSEKKYRNIVNLNFGLIIRGFNDNKDFQTHLFQAISGAVVRYYNVDKSWKLSYDFLSSIVFKELQASTNVTIESAEQFLEYTYMIDSITAHNNESIHEILCKIIKEADKFFTDKEHLKLNAVLHKCLTISSNSVINQKTLNEINELYFKDERSSSKNTIQHAVIQVIVREFVRNMTKCELSEKCYLQCCDFLVVLFNYIKHIKEGNRNSQKCCSDIKRHLISKLSCRSLEYGNRLIKAGIFTKKVERYILYFNDFGSRICKEMSSCPSYQKSLADFFNSLLNISISLTGNKTLTSVLNIFSSVYKSLVVIQKLFTDEKVYDRERLISLGYRITNVTYDKEQIENVQIFAETIMYPIIFTLLENDSITPLSVKMIYFLHEAVVVLKYTSVIDYMEEKLKNSEFASYNLSPEKLKLVMVSEIEAINRYAIQNVKAILNLFQRFCNKNDDVKLFAKACCIPINEDLIKEMDVQKLKDLNDRLEKYVEKDGNDNIELSIALALNNHRFYFMETHKLEALIKDTMSENKNEVPACLTLENELKIIMFLDKSLEYFTNVLLCLKKNPDNISKISSLRSFINILENISTQYFVRGIGYKDLETKLVLWNFIPDEKYPEELLDVAAYFLDNSKRLKGNTGQYIMISKKLKYVKIEDLIHKANGVLEKLLSEIESKPEGKQVRPLNYMLSLWTYYMLKGEISNGRIMWSRFVNARKLCKLENAVYNGTLEAKTLVGIVDINEKCFNRNSITHLYKAIIHLQSIRIITADYVNNFNFIYRTIILKVINHAINRMVDLDHYTTAMLTIKNQAMKKGLFVKVLDLLSLSTLRNLNIQKIEEAKADLNSMTKMLQLRDEIMVESPLLKKSYHFNPVLNVEQNAITARKAIPKTAHNHSVIEIFNDSFERANDLIQQLQNFVHEKNCKCSLCRYPQLKFILFQMGCHYSRMFFLMDRFDVSESFNKYAIDPWRNSSMKILRSKDLEAFSINKTDFVSFSIRWLFQVADTFVKIKKYSDVEEIYTEVELLCTSSIEDYTCIKQGLLARMQNLEFLQHHKDFDKVDECKLNFADFIKSRPVKIPPLTSNKTAKSVPKKIATATTTANNNIKKVVKKTALPKQVESVIYIDSDSEKSNSPSPGTSKAAEKPLKRSERLRKK